jgi:hypothetical protein
MTTKRILALFTTVLLLLPVAFSQQYNHSVGIRLGLKSGIAYKGFVTESSAFEVIGLHKNNYSSLTGLYEFHFCPFYSDNLLMFGGLGGHVDWVRPSRDHAFSVIGADAIFGIEYALSDVPLSFCIDVKPALQIVGRQRLDIGWFGVTGRITL